MLKRVSYTLALLGSNHRYGSGVLQTIPLIQCNSYYTLSRASYASTQTPADNSTVAAPSPPSLFPTGGAASDNSESNETALDVAMSVNNMKKQHQSGGAGVDKKQIEADAWTALNALTEEQVNTAEGKAVALLLNSWAYFAKYWENGKDGPGKGTKSD
ncbi:unnamed protein product [Phytomonas sp. EM1]|nr:unnamed protein product [Phytomonas sp. EM1]|eukprot:CCW62312.1 unnamed protein product [Phytomonas sp. isolate EM1]